MVDKEFELMTNVDVFPYSLKVENNTYPLYYKNIFYININYLEFIKLRVSIKEFELEDYKDLYILGDEKVKVKFDYFGEVNSYEYLRAFNEYTNLLVKLV